MTEVEFIEDWRIQMGANMPLTVESVMKYRELCVAPFRELKRASQPGRGEAEPIGYMNERAVSILEQGSVMCTHVSPTKTEFQQVAIYREAR